MSTNEQHEAAQSTTEERGPAPEEVSPPDGASPFGKYQLFAAIGSGGMAEVFLAVAPGPRGFNKLVVVKRLRANLASEGDEFVNMFLDEARLAARLNHPNIVHTYEVGEHEGALFIAMEYLDGQSLNRLRDRCNKQHAKVPIPIAVRMISDALAGLHHAHELKDYDGTPLAVVHRDISPHNIFATYDGATKIVDFGIAKATLNSTQTATGTFKGKPGYMAPEQATDANCDRRADVFAMGVVLFELATGTRLFPGDAVQALHKVIAGEIPRAAKVSSEVDEELDAIIAKALVRKPAERYQTAEEMRQALEAWLRAQARHVEAPDVARFVGELFHDVRENIRRRIDAQMKSVALQQTHSGISLKSIAAHGVGSASPFVVSNGTPPRLDLDAISGAGSLPSGTGSQASSTGSQTHLAPPPPSRRWAVVAVALTLAVVGGVVMLAPRAAPLPPTASAPPPSAAAAPAAPTATTVYVTLLSEPAGASIMWNGRVMGATPATLDMPPGRQSVTFSKEGYEASAIELDVPTSSPLPLMRTVTLAANGAAKGPVAAAPHGEPRARAGAPAAAPPVAPAPPPAATPPPAAAAAPPPDAPKKPNVRILDDAKPKVRVVE